MLLGEANSRWSTGDGDMRSLKNKFDADVLVLGLGPAGASAAVRLAEAGHSVIAIDRKVEAGVPVQCAEFVPSMIGQAVGDIASSYRQSIGAMDTFLEDEDKTHTPNFRGTMVSRADFDKILIKKASDAGVDCRFGMPIRRVHADGAVELSSGELMRARAIIGADGPRSLAGKAIGQVNTECVETRQITVPLLTNHDATDIFLSNDIVGGYGWLFPKGDHANLGLGVLPKLKSELKHLLEHLHKQLIDQGRVGKTITSYTGGLIPVGGMLDAVGYLADIPVLLVGDAAGLANPITGAGINAAVQSGEMAGSALSSSLRGETQALDDYREELEDLFGASLNRALRARHALLDHYRDGGKADIVALKSAWIAYPEYWAAR